MDSEKTVQAEDKPATIEPEENNSPETATPAPKKGLLDRALPWIIVSLVSLLVGALVTFFALYQPKIAALKTAQADLAAATESVATLQGQVDTANGDLASAKTTIEELNDTLLTAVKYGLIYEFQADVNAALASLATHESTSAKLSLGYALDDLKELGLTDISADTLAGFKEKVEEANTKATLNPDDAIFTLQKLQTDLLNLIRKLE